MAHAFVYEKLPPSQQPLTFWGGKELKWHWQTLLHHIILENPLVNNKVGPITVLVVTSWPAQGTARISKSPV